VVSKAISLIADGARDGAVARAVHDALYARRRGQVSATLTIISADTDHEQLIISRNSNCPVLVLAGSDAGSGAGSAQERGPEAGAATILDEETMPIGTQRLIRPHIVQLPLKEPRTVIAFSDGILSSGKGKNDRSTIDRVVAAAAELVAETPQQISGGILDWALERDQGRPSDDISVVAVKVAPSAADREVREMTMTFPL
jgi:serine phosphatase RsbU (regulator of sigma subunit)